MCSHYQGVREQERYRRQFGVSPPHDMGKTDMWPGYEGTFIRRHPPASTGDGVALQREALLGLFGLVPSWSLDTRITQQTYHARSEAAASQPSFRDAWKRGQHCIIPAEAFYEPDWRSGRPIPTRIARADGEPMGMAGLWSVWQSPQGAQVHSFAVLTRPAAHHPLMRLFQKPADDAHCAVVLPETHYDAWLDAHPEQSMPFLRQPYSGLSAGW